MIGVELRSAAVGGLGACKVEDYRIRDQDNNTGKISEVVALRSRRDLRVSEWPDPSLSCNDLTADDLANRVTPGQGKMPNSQMHASLVDEHEIANAR